MAKKENLVQTSKIPETIQKLIEEKQGINLDIGCGSNKNSGFVGMDILDLPGVDIVWNFERTPWPLPDECVLKAVASHVLEHIPPMYEAARLEPLVQLLVKKGVFSQEEADAELGKPSRGFLGFMDELWRVMKVGGQFAFVVPHASSPGFQQDPSHINMINETCVTPDTEVLTYGGFKPITEITEEDKVLSLNPQTLEPEYVEDCKLLSFHRKGEMVHFAGRAIDLVTTPNHRIWYSTRKLAAKGQWQFAEADQFIAKNPDTTLFSSSMEFEGEDNLDYEIDRVEPLKESGIRSTNKTTFDVDDFAEFMGWYLAEGNSEVTEGPPSYYRVHIAQKTEWTRPIIESLIKKLGFNPQMSNPDKIVFSAYSLAHWLKKFGVSYQKYIPRDLLHGPKSARTRMFNAFMMTDGIWVRGGKQFQYATTSKQLADDVQFLAMSLGWRASIAQRPTGTMNITGKEYATRRLYLVLGSRYSDIYANRFEVIENYEGAVHSLDMPKNHIYMARRNNKCVWTGNSMHYFDPDPEGRNIGQQLFGFYRPKPWRIVHQYYNPQGNLEVLLEKRVMDSSYEGKLVPYDITQELAQTIGGKQ